jgi:oligoribonuclease NrnB/cAMP/cGMP phosphodiesterase (DHH superfamily)
MITHIAFHRADLDGIGSCMVVLRHLLSMGMEAKDIILHAWNYGEPTPSFIGDMVYIVDCSFNPNDMKEIYQASLDGQFKVAWIDHHQTAYDDSVRRGYDQMFGKRVLNRPAAIELCWYYLQNEQAPLGIRLLSKYDTWCNEDAYEWKTEILPFQFGMRLTNWLNLLNEARADTKALQRVVDKFFN